MGLSRQYHAFRRQGRGNIKHGGSLNKRQNIKKPKSPPGLLVWNDYKKLAVLLKPLDKTFSVSGPRVILYAHPRTGGFNMNQAATGDIGVCCNKGTLI
ncbi:hypothetical protein GW536_17970 (plasmid) [Piscirickettsia salmonis]|nr:hypothetical protein GW536_17970 [Piscirickettsia salmonis]